MFKHWT